MKRIKFLVASVLFCAMGYVGYTAHAKMTMSEAEKFMKANIEALTLDEPGGGGGSSTPCKDTGYKTWFTTSNNPLQRKQAFHDCFCRDKEGYDPVNC